MAHSASGTHRTIQPVPTVPILAVGLADPYPPAEAEERNDESLRPVSSTDGFASDAREALHVGVPWEQRPLSRRGILGWTIASVVLMVALIATVAMAIARSGTSSATHGAGFVGSEVTEAAHASIPPAPESSNSAAAVVPSPPIPLEALPKEGAKAPQPTRAAVSHSRATPKKAHKALAVSARAPLVAPKAPALGATPVHKHSH